VLLFSAGGRRSSAIVFDGPVDEEWSEPPGFRDDPLFAKRIHLSPTVPIIHPGTRDTVNLPAVAQQLLERHAGKWESRRVPRSGEMNKLFYGENLNILRENIADESVDLIYLDPPFNSKRDYTCCSRRRKATSRRRRSLRLKTHGIGASRRKKNSAS
jgi:hypothetical protein